MIAALYVETGGVYYGLPDVDPWDEERDARLYDGPWPVVAHPPCARWSSLAYINRTLHGHQIGDDGGCFAAALRAVREFGGVLEHPAGSLAWKQFGLPIPGRGGWTSSLLDDPGMATEVSQVIYGHRARKWTWLYCVGVSLPALDWRDAEAECLVGDLWHRGRRVGRGDRPRMYQREALSTPLAFRDVLLDMARSSPH